MAKFKPDLTVPITPGASVSPPRNKVSLKPGRSLMDWIRLTNSGKDLTGTGGRILEVSPRELAKHNSKHDAWIALQGKVYNITHYMEFHPGGEDELMRGAGKDATDLFNQVHRWVNFESMLQKCFVGVLKKSWSLDIGSMIHLKAKSTKKLLTPSDDIIKEGFKSTEKKLDNNCGSEIKKSKSAVDVSMTFSTESEDTVDEKIVIPVQGWPIENYEEHIDVKVTADHGVNCLKFTLCKSTLTLFGVITQMINQKVYVKLNDSLSVIVITLPLIYKKDYQVFVQDGMKLELSLTKLTNDFSENKKEPEATFYKLKDIIYWSCKLVKKSKVNHNSFLFTFSLPVGTQMWVPIGRHVQFKTEVEGMDIIRSYTPVLPLLSSENDTSNSYNSNELNFLIKVYPEGLMSQKINNCEIGEQMFISSYSGSFSETFLESCDSAILLAAGTGITPMIRVINWFLPKNKAVELLFFNKTEDDILWKTELEQCSYSFDNFSITHILSEPSKDWNGLSSQLNTDFIKQITAKDTGIKHKFFACGPILFCDAALKCFNDVGCSSEDFYIFSGS